MLALRTACIMDSEVQLRALICTASAFMLILAVAVMLHAP